MFTPHIVLCAIQGVAPRLAIDPWGADNIFVAHLCTCLHLYSSFHYLYICIYICHPHYMSTSTWITRKALVCCICPTSINGSMTDHWKATEMRSSLIRMLVELGIGGGSIICILYVWDGADPIPSECCWWNWVMGGHNHLPTTILNKQQNADESGIGRCSMAQ